MHQSRWRSHDCGRAAALTSRLCQLQRIFVLPFPRNRVVHCVLEPFQLPVDGLEAVVHVQACVGSQVRILGQKHGHGRSFQREYRGSERGDAALDLVELQLDLLGGRLSGRRPLDSPGSGRTRQRGSLARPILALPRPGHGVAEGLGLRGRATQRGLGGHSTRVPGYVVLQVQIDQPGRERALSARRRRLRGAHLARFGHLEDGQTGHASQPTRGGAWPTGILGHAVAVAVAAVAVGSARALNLTLRPSMPDAAGILGGCRPIDGAGPPGATALGRAAAGRRRARGMARLGLFELSRSQ